VFVENIFRISEKFLIIPGLRYEWLEGSATGRDKYNLDSSQSLLQNVKRGRSFILAGVGAEYHVSRLTEVYANFTQAYRPIQFANLQAPPSTNSVDPDLKDSKGYNIDLGYRGKIKSYLQFDISAYLLQYNNRIGNLPLGTVLQVTNVGNSISKGFEGYLEFNAARALTNNQENLDLIIFGSYGYTNAKYTKYKIASQGEKVENAPENIFRGGITFGYKHFLFTGQLSYVDKAFSDAANTVAASPNGQNGIIPSYSVTDLTASYKFSKGFNVKAGINNVFDERYFTRRAGGYPGPGVLPGDGRSFFVSVGAKL
jgi:Fe(3+) dicitrate transport protein